MNADLSTTLKCSASGRKSMECLNMANVSTRVVASVLLPHTSCISLCTILVNYTTCTQTLSPTPTPRKPHSLPKEKVSKIEFHARTSEKAVQSCPLAPPDPNTLCRKVESTLMAGWVGFSRRPSAILQHQRTRHLQGLSLGLQFDFLHDHLLSGRTPGN